MNKKYVYLVIIFLIIACLAAYGRILGNGFINFDDDVYITENQHIQSGFNTETIKWSFTAIVSSNWHPLTLISHSLDWSLFKDNATGHHLINLLLHIINVLLLFLFLNKTTKNLWPSAFVAVLFALHPLRVESVAWAAERKDVLSMFFCLATFYIYANYVEKRQLSQYLFCLLLFILGLMVKPMLVTLPFVFMLLDIWPLKRWQRAIRPVKSDPLAFGRQPVQKKTAKQTLPGASIARASAPGALSTNRLIFEKAPFIFFAGLSSILTIWAQSNGGAVASLQKLPLSERMINAVISYSAYLGKIFWPVDLAVFYPYQRDYPGWQVSGAFLILLGISVMAIYSFKKAPFFLVGWFWYLGTLVPVIGIVQVGGQALADRYTYLPSIGIGIVLGWGIFFLLPKEKFRKIILIPAMVIVFTVLTILSWQQCGYWKNSIELFNHTLKVTKDNYLAHTNLGVALAAEGKYTEAMVHYQDAIRAYPNFDNAYYNLANALKDQGNIEGALNNFRKTISINPSFLNAHNNLGIILEMYYKKYDEAIYHYRQELKMQPDNPGVHYNMGIALAQKGELKEAISHFRTAIYLRPDYEAARKWLRLTLEKEQP